MAWIRKIFRARAGQQPALRRRKREAGPGSESPAPPVSPDARRQMMQGLGAVALMGTFLEMLALTPLASVTVR